MSEPKICITCLDPKRAVISHGECSRCNTYRLRWGVPRPDMVKNGRRSSTDKTGPCSQCDNVTIYAKGMCKRCCTYASRTGRLWTPKPVSIPKKYVRKFTGLTLAQAAVRFVKVLSQVSGKRLTWNKLTEKGSDYLWLS